MTSDPMTSETDAAAGRRSSSLLGDLLEPLVVVALFAGAGAAAGWLWERWWNPIGGVVVDGTWVAGYRPVGDTFVFDFPSLKGFFDSTAEYVVIGVVAGLVLGVLCSLLGRRSEIVMLAAVVIGAALAGFVAYRLGTHLGPVDPATLEADAADGTALPSSLTISGASPFVAWPLGALLGLALTYLLTVGRVGDGGVPPDADWAERPSWLDEGSTGTRSGTATS